MTQVRTDGLGMTHARLRQTMHGLEVVNADLRVHVRRDGTVYAVNGYARADNLPDPTPTVSADMATVTARDTREGTASSAPPCLVYVVSTRDDSAHLAWEIEIRVGQYLPSGVGTDWQRVVIPLAAFAAIKDWSAVTGIVIAFENRVGSAKGTIEVDDLRFEALPPMSIVVDNFNADTGENGVGGTHWTGSGGAASLTNTYENGALALTYRGESDASSS